MTGSVMELMQGIPVRDSFEAWIHYIDLNKLFVKDSLVDNYRLYFHIPANRAKSFFPKERPLHLSAFRVEYEDTISKFQNYSQETIEAIVYFENDSSGIQIREALYLRLKEFLKQSFYNVKDQGSSSHPEIKLVISGPGNDSWIFVIKDVEKRTNRLYLKIIYRETMYPFRKR